jgi:hypothetical protein
MYRYNVEISLPQSYKVLRILIIDLLFHLYFDIRLLNYTASTNKVHSFNTHCLKNFKAQYELFQYIERLSKISVSYVGQLV